MASPARLAGISSNGAFAFSQTSALKPHPIASRAAGASVVTALSVEFVAKPQEAHRVQATIPAAVAGALKEVSGFAGCLVMISDQEARLVTVVTLWAGDDRRKRCGENARWVHALLAPYLDRSLRVQPWSHTCRCWLRFSRKEARPASVRLCSSFLQKMKACASRSASDSGGKIEE